MAGETRSRARWSYMRGGEGGVRKKYRVCKKQKVVKRRGEWIACKGEYSST